MHVTKVEVLHRTKFLNLNCSHYTDNKGAERKWLWAERPNCTRAVIVAALHGDKLVAIREYRVPINSYIWSLPAGLVDINESSLEAATRETMEETGLTITKFIRPLSPTTRSSPGLTDERVDIAFAHVEGTPCTKLNESSEDIEVHLLSCEEVAKIFLRREEICSRAYLVMLRFAEDGKI